jgi:predicted restriction endonuclease
VAATKILKRDETVPSFDQWFNYWCTVCKLNFLKRVPDQILAMPHIKWQDSVRIQKYHMQSNQAHC